MKKILKAFLMLALSTAAQAADTPLKELGSALADLKLAVTEFKNTVALDAAESSTKSGGFFKDSKEQVRENALFLLQKLSSSRDPSEQLLLKYKILEFISKNAQITNVFGMKPDAYLTFPLGSCLQLAANKNWHLLHNLISACWTCGAVFNPQDGVSLIRTDPNNPSLPYLPATYLPQEIAFHLSLSPLSPTSFMIQPNPEDLRLLRSQGLL